MIMPFRLLRAWGGGGGIMAADPNECRDHKAVIPGLLRSLQKLQQMFEQWIARESGSGCSLYLASLAITFGLLACRGTYSQRPQCLSGFASHFSILRIVTIPNRYCRLTDLTEGLDQTAP